MNRARIEDPAALVLVRVQQGRTRRAELLLADMDAEELEQVRRQLLEALGAATAALQARKARE